MSNLEKAVEIANRLDQDEDARPLWLKNLPHARDPHALYYHALYEWARELKPTSVLEIGTDRGWSAAAMAAPYDDVTVVTVDINADSTRFVEKLPLTHVVSLIMSSTTALPEVMSYSPFDMVFIDGNHTFNQVYGEYELYRPLVRQGGLMLFDDVGLVMEGDEMGVFWDFVVDRKERLDHLHHTGFGVCEVDHRVRLPPWSEIIVEATRIIHSRRR